MGFEDGNIKGQNSEENLKRKQQRKNAMFGNRNIDDNISRAVFPIDERVNLPMELIDEHPDNEKVFNMDFIQELADVMAERYYGAIEVYQKDDGRFEILSGHRRYRARKLNGDKTIPAIISEKPTEIERAKRLICSNIHNRRLTPLDYARSIDYYIDNVLVPSGFSGDKTKECSRVFMISVTHIKRYRAINKMIPQLKDLLVNTSFPFTALDGARTFSEEEQLKLYNEILRFKKENPDTEISELYIKQTINQISKKKPKNAEPRTEDNTNRTMVRQGPSETPPVLSKEKETERRERPSVNFSSLDTSYDAEEKNNGEQSNEIPLRKLSALMESYFLQLNNIDINKYDTADKDEILTTIYKIQDKLKYLESLIK